MPPLLRTISREAAGQPKQPVIGRLDADLDIGMPGAFAVLAIVELVALPIGLYMVTMPAISAT